MASNTHELVPSYTKACPQTLPLGPTIPVLATLGCILFLNGIKLDDVIFSLATLAVGLVLHAAWRVFGRRAVLGAE